MAARRGSASSGVPRAHGRARRMSAQCAGLVPPLPHVPGRSQMALFPPVNGYYKITFNSNGTGGSFDFEVNIFAGPNQGYQGNGYELVGGNATGSAALLPIAQGIAQGIEQVAAPSWDNITVVSIEAQPVETNTIYP